jgi:flagellar assembly protein FliH
MATTRRFLFDTSFDDGSRPFERMRFEPPPPPPEPEPEPEPPPPPEPTFGKADLLQAHEDGYADGFAAGKAAAEASAAARAAAAAAALEGHLAALLAGLADEAAARRERAVEVGLAVARKLLPAAARDRALGEVEAMVAAAAAEMIDEPRLVIRVAEAMAEDLAERLDALTSARGFSGRVVLLAEPALEFGDCRIEWAEGGVERSTGRLWQEIDRLAARRAAETGSPRPAAPDQAAPDPAGARSDAELAGGEAPAEALALGA